MSPTGINWHKLNWKLVFAIYGFLSLQQSTSNMSSSQTRHLYFWKCRSTVPSGCYPAPAAGRFGARESYYRLCVASTTSATMRRAIETPRDTDQWGHRTHGWGAERAFAPGTRQRIGSAAPVGSTLSDRRREWHRGKRRDAILKNMRQLSFRQPLPTPLPTPPSLSGCPDKERGGREGLAAGWWPDNKRIIMNLKKNTDYIFRCRNFSLLYIKYMINSKPF